MIYRPNGGLRIFRCIAQADARAASANRMLGLRIANVSPAVARIGTTTLLSVNFEQWTS